MKVSHGCIITDTVTRIYVFGVTCTTYSRSPNHLTLLLSRTPFDLAARYDVAEGVARPHDAMAQPPKLSFSNGKISRTLCRRHVGPTPSDLAPETLPTLKFKFFTGLPL